MNRRSCKSTLSLFAAVLLFFLSPAGMVYSSPAETADKDQPGKQLVMALDEAFGELERPPTLFDHKKHTDELKEEGCRLCHEPNEEGKVTYELFRLDEDADKRAIIDANHERCMACHGGDAKGSEKAKALACGECHIEEVGYRAYKWYRATFNHASHFDSMEKGCETCHHKYDEQTGESIYKKGDEAACGSCHKNKDEGKKKPLRTAGHTQCIGCHEEQYPEVKKDTDPYACIGCHKPEEKPAEIHEITLAARPYEKRPEKLLLSYPRAILPGVPFDHKKHVPEDKDECAKTCHQFHARTLARFDTRFAKTGNACQECHMVIEKEMASAAVDADKVYHDPESPHSCRGCHIEKNKEPKKEEEKSPETCKGCHTGGEDLELAVAEFDLEARPEGPETYVIERLSRKRLPVKFPHGNHAKMVDNCDACHHESPEKEIPTCYACHGSSTDFNKKSKLQLVGAYHRMCIGCHRSMGDGPITCNKCHEEKETDQPLQVSEEMVAPDQDEAPDF